MIQSRVSAGVAVVLLSAWVAACTEQDPGSSPSRSSSPSVSQSSTPPALGSPATLAAPECDSEALRTAPELTTAITSRFAGRAVQSCDVTTEPGSTPGYEVTQVSAEVTATEDHRRLARLIAYDGGPIPSDCEISTSSRLLVLVGDTWMEGRQVRCSGDS